MDTIHSKLAIEILGLKTEDELKEKEQDTF
jgi:hypothetical protein